MILKPDLPRPIVAVLAVLGVLFALDLFAIGASRKLEQAIAELHRQTQILTALVPLPVIVLNMQSGMRGYLLTGDQAVLARYRVAADRFPGAVESALTLVGENEVRVPLEEAAALTKRWLDSHLSPLVVKRNAGEGRRASMNTIVEAMKTDRGEILAGRIRDKLDAVLDTQTLKVEAARSQLQAQSDNVGNWMRARAIALLVTVAALALMLGRTLMQLSGQTSSRETAERKARASSAALQAMNDASPLGMFVTDASGICDHANAALERITNLAAANLQGTGWQAALHPHDRERVLSAWNYAIERQSPFASEHRFLHRNGNVVWVAIKTAQMSDGENLIGYVCTVEDVTKRRNMEDALRRSEERLQLALENSHLALFDWHVPSGEIVFSRQWSMFSGNQPEPTTTTARRFAELLHAQDREGLREAVVAAFKGRTPKFEAEFRVRTHNGQWKRLRSQGRVTERDVVGRAVQLTGTITGAD